MNVWFGCIKCGLTNSRQQGMQTNTFVLPISIGFQRLKSYNFLKTTHSSVESFYDTWQISHITCLCIVVHCNRILVSFEHRLTPGS